MILRIMTTLRTSLSEKLDPILVAPPQTVTGLWTGRFRIRYRQRQRIVSSTKRSDCFSEPHSLLFNGKGPPPPRNRAVVGANLTTHLHLALMFKCTVLLFFFNLGPAAFKAYCAIWFRRSNFRHQTSPRVSPRESTQRRKVELWARNVW